MSGPNATSAGSLAVRLPSLSLRRRPVLAVEVLIVAAWIGLLGWSLAAAGSPSGAGSAGSMAGMTGMASMPGMAMGPHSSDARAAVLGLPMWIVMALAMMLPGVLPALTRVADGAPRRRAPAMTLFVVVFIGGWAIFGVAALLMAGAVHAPPGTEVGLALGLAVVWQLTAFKRHALADCHRAVATPERTWAGPAAVARFGLDNAGACVRSCWPAMLAMAFVPESQMWIWMPALSALMWGERLARRPRRATWLVAAGLAVAAAAAIVVV